MRKETDSYGNTWYYNDLNQYHREDGPAIEYANGTKSWFLNGQPHREDGPAVECADGTKYWCRNGQYHREDGPAIDYANGTKYWCRNGQYHREDGPAVEFADGRKEYRLLDIQYKTKKDYLKRLKLKAFW
jgi:hypothetical protein